MIENKTSPAPQAAPLARMTGALKLLKDRAARFRLAGPAPRVEFDADIELLRLLEMANAAIVRHAVRMDPDYLDFEADGGVLWHLCLWHADVLETALLCRIQAETIVLALREAQAEGDEAPQLQAIATEEAELARKLVEIARARNTPLFWTPRQHELKAGWLQLAELTKEVRNWDRQEAQVLLEWLLEMAALCRIVEDSVHDHIDLADLPSVELPADCTGEEIYALDLEGNVIVGCPLDRKEARVVPLAACYWAFPGRHWTS
ncbi:MAG: hypothetical protein ACU0A8_02750 [Limimaricola soesokkakensis]|uniref:hypothetical protein n=1 Tax=Limimaricola soesokkakensis TaxID=1343159 RepID=UPI004059464C